MPLAKGSSQATISGNIREMRRAGYTENRAVAAAMHTAHPLRPPPRAKRDFGGGFGLGPGASFASRFDSQEARGEAATGFVHLGSPGRTDVLPVSPAAGSYVVPADVVAGLGQDNSLAGAGVIQRMLSTGPGGIPLQRTGHGNNIPRPPPPFNPNANPYATPQPHFAFGGDISRTLINIPHESIGAGHVPSIHAPAFHVPGIPKLKSGGAAKEKIQYDEDGNVPVLIAGGEFVIPADIVQHHPLIGAGSLKRGHAVLDAWVLHERGKHIKALTKLPPPKK